MKLIKSSIFMCFLSILSYVKVVNANTLTLPTKVNNSNISLQEKVVPATRQIALDLSQQYLQLAPTIKENINEYQLTLNATDFVQSQQLTTIYNVIQETPWLSGINGSLVQLRLANKNALNAWQRGALPLFTYEPTRDGETWNDIEAFDIHGNKYLLDPYIAPAQPVFIVELNSKKILTAGLASMRKIFSKARTSTNIYPSPHFGEHNLETPTSTTILKKVSLKDNHEPWFLGDSEIYAIVTGVNQTSDMPILDVIEMPYLKSANQNYYPNQVIINWEHYRWAAADILIMEHDDNTNYQELANTLLNAAENILASIPNLETQQYAAIVKITNGILQAMPKGWFQQSDDFVDVYYTLLEGAEYNDLNGANANANSTLEPLIIAPRQ